MTAFKVTFNFGSFNDTVTIYSGRRAVWRDDFEGIIREARAIFKRRGVYGLHPDILREFLAKKPKVVIV
jgi:hypothetical protein